MNRKQFLQQLIRMEIVDDNWVQENEKDLKQIVGYIWNAFIYTPQALKFLNKHLNTYDFNSFQLAEKVRFIHFVIHNTGLAPSWLNTDFQPRIDRIKDAEMMGNEITVNDKRALWHLANEFGIFEIRGAKDVANKPQKLTQQEKQRIQDAVQRAAEQKSNTVVLKELTQDVIDEMELMLFDISVLEKRNMIQYTFLDKNNLKVVYREPYSMKIKFHPSTNIFEKDYFESFDNLYEYQFTNIWDYQQFRKVLNAAFLNGLKV